MADPERRSRRFFVNDTGSSRRPIDLLLTVVGALIVLLSTVAVSDGGGPLDRAVRRVAVDLPDFVANLFDAAYALGALYAAVAVLLAVLSARRRQRLLLTLAIAVGTAVAGVLVTSVLVGAGLPDLAPGGPVRASTPDTFPTVRVAATTAVLFALRPWLVLAYRRLSMAIVAVQCLAAWIIGTGGPTDVIGALGVGMVAAGLALSLLGSPAGHPDLAQVHRSMADLGVDADDLSFTENQPWGVRSLLAVSPSLGPLEVKVYGRDATDAHRAARWWRTLLYRDQSVPDATRIQLVEHEALVTVLADRAGVGVPDVVAAASSSQGDAVLVLTAPPPPLQDAADLDDGTLRAMWDAVGRLHRAGLVHTRLTLESIGLAPDGTVVIADFADGRIAATPAERHRETATLLTALAVRVGADRSADSAIDRLGPESVSAVLPYLQRAALPRSLRAEDGVKAALTGLATTIIDRTGVSAPPPAPIVRLKWQDLLQTALILVAAYALLSTLVGLDWPTVLETWQNATWAWVFVGLVIAQVTAPVDAVSTMSAVTTRLPLWPLTQLQYAIKTVGLAISATAGRIALTTSFLRRFGEGPAVAVTASALDSFAASVCNVLVVLIGVLLAQNLPALDLGGPDDLSQILELLAMAIIVSAVLVALVAPLRRKLVQALLSAWVSLRVVAASPTRALLMFGSNLVSLLVTGLTMACMCAGLYPGVGYGESVFVVAAAALFAALIPVPGNVGVAEAALAAGLVAIGVPSGPAFAIAVTQRIATSYLPPIYGGWALRWLRREDYIS